jgi:hypothetical protein
MLLKHQWYFSSLCLLILLDTACASQLIAFDDDVIANPSATVSAYTVTEKTPIPIQTSASELTPKHNDLLFVEFFAVT